MIVIPASRKLGQEDYQELEAAGIYIECSRPG